MQRAVNYLNFKPHLYIIDGYAEWDSLYRLKIRVITTRVYHALFMNTMLIKPSKEEFLNNFDKIDYHIINAGEFPVDTSNEGVTLGTLININFEQKQTIILGTEYAGDLRNALFSIFHYEMKEKSAFFAWISQ